MGCLTILLLRKALHEVELSSTFHNELPAAIDNIIAQYITPPATCLAILRQF